VKRQQVKRQRQDFHHKEARKLVQQHDTIYLEDLQVANMVKNHRLAKSISDASWAQFRAILAAKAAYAGRRVVAVPPADTSAYTSADTSQDCSGCGRRVRTSLSVRTHICPNPTCGLVLDRDENAAKNMAKNMAKNRERAGQALRGAVA
jgi:putative transposase